MPLGKVLVAMSGGVDSSVACSLLKDMGFDVVGVTMRLLPQEESGVVDSKKVCDLLGVPHHILDVTESFDKEVVAPFVKEYQKGRTPNPCVWCNKRMKFGRLLEKADELGADYMATGHYARTAVKSVQGGFIDLFKKTGEDGGQNTVHLLRGLCSSKDQSYALYSLSQPTLRRIIFPLGALTKEEVRRIAKEKGLATWQKGESQEICFVPQDDYREFLKAKGAQNLPGLILDEEGRVLGEHDGLWNFTVGQRRGLGAYGVTGRRPRYVIEIQPSDGTVVVGYREHSYAQGCVIEALNLTVKKMETASYKGTCMVRYRGKEVPSVMNIVSPQRADVLFDAPQFAVTPGQSLVFYQGDEVLGGGIITKSLMNGGAGRKTESLP